MNIVELIVPKSFLEMCSDAWAFVFDREARILSSHTYPSGMYMSVRAARKAGLLKMEIDNSRKEPFHFTEDVFPLFEAMEAGKLIKSVTCFAGTVNKDNSSKDFTIRNFVASEYCVSAQSRGDERFDLVKTRIGNEDEQIFYMNWVKSFELY